MRAYNAWRHSGHSALQTTLMEFEILNFTTRSLSTSARTPVEMLRRAISGVIDTPESPSYASHVPLSVLQKGAFGVLASLGAFADPRRADLVAVVGETTGVPALRSIRNRMLHSAEGRELLADRPRITDAAVARCWDLPPTTFGGAYAQFMGERGFRADERPAVRFVDDPELAWVAARAREVHDFWHVLFDCHTNVFGESALKAVEFVQTGLPMTAMAVVAGEFRMKTADRRLMNKVFLPWAVRAGSKSADLMTIYYEKHFDEDLVELRERWRIEVAPPPPPSQKKRSGSVSEK